MESAHLALIAIDFRLCPQVTLPELLDDVHDSITFVLGGALGQALGAAGLASNILDTSRWGISGSSAGGWSALLAGLAPRVPTPPSVIVAIYPITDVTRTGGDFFYTPLCPLPWAPPAASEIQRIVPRELVAAYLDKSAPPSSESPPATNPERAQLYNWARQEGCYPSLVLPSNSTGEEFSVASLLRARTSAPPPIFVVYGSGDVKVPFSQSEAVLAALKEKGFEHGALVREGLDHLYDMAPEYEERELWAYVAKYLNA